jgi:ribose 5-phosphate isomerase B
MSSGAEAMVIAVGADSLGRGLLDVLVADLRADPRVLDVIDLGVPSADDPMAYPHVGIAVAEAVARGDAQRALLVCGTGIGMAISANKVRGVRAAVAHDPYSLERSVRSNDCQVLCMGANVVAPALARSLLASWLDHNFDPTSPSDAKVAVIRAYEAGTTDEGPASG